MSPISDCGKISALTDEKRATSGDQQVSKFSPRGTAKNLGLSPASKGDEELPSVKKCSVIKVKEEEGQNTQIDQCLSAVSKSSSKVINADRKRKPKIRLMVDIYAAATRCTLEELEIRNGRTWPPIEEDQALDLSKEAGKGETEGSSSTDPTLQSMLASMGKWSCARRTMSSSKKTTKRKHVENKDAMEDCDVVLSALRKMSSSRGKRRRKLIIAESQSDSLAGQNSQEHSQPDEIDSLNSKRVETENCHHLQTGTNLNSMDTQFSKLQQPEKEVMIAVATTPSSTNVLRLMGKNIVVINNTL